MAIGVSLIAGVASAQHIAPSALLTIDENRTTVVERIVGQWGDPLARSNVCVTSAQLREILNGLRADHLLAASLAGSIEGLRDVVSGALLHADAAVSPGLMRAKSQGDNGDDLVYTPIVPCRILDTRNGTSPPYNAPMMGGSAFPVAANLGNFAPQGGSATNCNLPFSFPAFAAIVVTLTVLNPNFDAFLAASSASDFTAIVPVDGNVKFYLGMPANVTTNVIADAVGYLRRPTNYGGTHTITGQYATDSGGFQNTASANSSTVTGGFMNIASGVESTVAGGAFNTASGTDSTVAGGTSNTASGPGGFVGGGSGNMASGGNSTAGGYHNTASGNASTVAGGSSNTASGIASTVAGGVGNTASGDYSFAAGNAASADSNGCFVFVSWSNALGGGCQGNPYIAYFVLNHGLSVSYHARQADGSGDRYVYMGDLSTGHTIATWTGAYLSDSGMWTNSSDVNRKTSFERIDPVQVLARVARLPITRWRYRGEDPSKRHVGPTAQDFRTAFGLGDDDKHIGTIDESGVALAAIQGLHQIVKQKDAKLRQQSREISAMKREILAMKAKLGLPPFSPHCGPRGKRRVTQDL